MPAKTAKKRTRKPSPTIDSKATKLVPKCPSCGATGKLLNIYATRPVTDDTVRKYIVCKADGCGRSWNDLFPRG